MDKTHVKVTIAGQEFRLASDDNEAYVSKITDYVNHKVSEVQKMYPSLSTANCVLLASLNLADELHKLKEDYEALDSRISQLREMPRQTPVKRPFESKAVTTK